MEIIKEALTFDDVTLAPNYSQVLPSEVDTSTNLSKNLSLKIPLLTSAMDTVTESKMAIAMAELGGIGVIHRNLNIEQQISEIRKVKAKKCLVGAAVGALSLIHISEPTRQAEISYAVFCLKKNGVFISKIFMGTSFNEIVELAKRNFKEFHVYKPPSSRKESKESFIICKNLR